LLIDQWFNKQGITPNIVGEFEDSALLTKPLPPVVLVHSLRPNALKKN
jgi:hypothetical protein